MLCLLPFMVRKCFNWVFDFSGYAFLHLFCSRFQMGFYKEREIVLLTAIWLIRSLLKLKVETIINLCIKVIDLECQVSAPFTIVCKDWIFITIQNCRLISLYGIKRMHIIIKTWQYLVELNTFCGSSSWTTWYITIGLCYFYPFSLLGYEGLEVINPEGGAEDAEEEAQRGRWKQEVHPLISMNCGLYLIYLISLSLH